MRTHPTSIDSCEAPLVSGGRPLRRYRGLRHRRVVDRDDQQYRRDWMGPTDQNGAHGITLDSRTIYWTNFHGSEVMKLAKK